MALVDPASRGVDFLVLSADWTVWVGRDRTNLYPALRKHAIAHKLAFDADEVLIEDAGSGTQLIQDLRNEGLNPRGIKPEGDKVTRILHLAFLAPDIVEAILDGQQPADLDLERLLKGIPHAWQDQQHAFGLQSC